MADYEGRHRAPWDEVRDESASLDLYFTVWRYTDGVGFGWDRLALRDVIDRDILTRFEQTIPSINPVEPFARERGLRCLDAYLAFR